MRVRRGVRGTGFIPDNIDVDLPFQGVDFHVIRLGLDEAGAHIDLYSDGTLFASLTTDAEGLASYRSITPPAGTITYRVYTANYSHGTTGSTDIDTPDTIDLSAIPTVTTDNWYAKPNLIATNGLAVQLQAPGNIAVYMGDFIASTQGDATRTWYKRTADAWSAADIGNGAGLAACLASMTGITFDCDDLAAQPVSISISMGNPAWPDPATWEDVTFVEIQDPMEFCGA